MGIPSQWKNESHLENEIQVIVDLDPFDVEEEFEFHESTEIVENEPHISLEPLDTLIVQNTTEVEEYEPQIHVEPFETMILQNSSENEENVSQVSKDFDDSIFDNGKVSTFGVAIFWDSSMNNPLSSIDWGNLEPGVNKNIECYIKNIGNTISILTLETTNWNPSEAATYIDLNWDYSGQSLNVNQVIRVTLILSISENIQGITSFFFDIIIIGNSI